MARASLLAVIAVILAGCSAAARLGVTRRPAASGASGTASGGAPPAASDPVVDPPQPFSGMLLPRQLAALRGVTVDEARDQLRRLGHDGPVTRYVLGRFLSGCARDRVCDVGPGGARGLHDEIVLWLNPGLDIAAPAPAPAP
jgi:hypothetical protein